MTENLVLAGVGGVAGVLIAIVGTRVFVATGPDSLPRLGEVALHWPVLVFTGVVTVGGRIRRSVLRQGVLFGVIGVGVGLPAVFALTRFVEAMLFAVKPTDPVTVGVVAGLLIATAALASDLPARRAAATDPIEVLRAD